jgi:predicted metal-binding membrane protein
MYHGLLCVGCGWALMLMVFAGAGNLAVMCAFGSVIAVEKNLRWGRHMVKPVV